MIDAIDYFYPLRGLDTRVLPSSPKADRFYYVGAAFYISDLIKYCESTNNIKPYVEALSEYYPAKNNKILKLDKDWLIENFRACDDATDNAIYREVIKQCYNHGHNKDNVPTMIKRLLGDELDEFFKGLFIPKSEDWGLMLGIPTYSSPSIVINQQPINIRSEDAKNDCKTHIADLTDLNEAAEVQISTEEHKIRELKRCLDRKKNEIYKLKMLTSTYTIVEELSNDQNYAFYKMDPEVLLSILESQGYKEDEGSNYEDKIDNIVEIIHNWQLEKIKASGCYSSQLPEQRIVNNPRSDTVQIENKLEELSEDIIEVKTRVVQIFDMVKSQGSSKFGDLAHIDIIKSTMIVTKEQQSRDLASVITQSSVKSKYIDDHGF